MKLDGLKSVILPRDQKSRTQLYIFLVCLAVSVFIWMIIKLSEENVTELSYDIDLVQVPGDKVLVSGSNQQLSIGFKEKLSDLFSLQFIRSREPVQVSMANVPLRQYGDRYKAIVFTSHIADYITKQQDFKIQIVSISPDTLVYVFEDLMEKKIPVQAEVNINTASRFMLYDRVRFIPDSITIRGPASMVDTTDAISIADIYLEDVRDSIRLQRPLQPIANNTLITFEPAEVEVVIPVEEFTEAELQVPVTIDSKISRKIKTFPEKVSVTFWVALSDYSDINPSMFRISADIDSAIDADQSRVKLQLESSPDRARNIRISPEKVEYIILDQ